MPGRENVFKQAMSAGHSAAWDQQWDKAAIAYQAALNEFPQDPKALNSLGMALFELQRYEESLQVYKQAAQITPTDPLPLEKVAQLSERLGNAQVAIQAFLRAAEIHIKSQDTERALANWAWVTQLDSEHIPAHTYLAMVHERLGHAPQAVTEYLATASLLQRTGKGDKAAEMIGRALHIAPNSQEARQAQTLFKSGQLLPKPMRQQGGTAELRTPEVKKLEAPKSDDTGFDPVTEANKEALAQLAEILFELSEETGEDQPARRGSMQAIVRGSTGPLASKQNDRTVIMLHLGQAIDAQTKEQESEAADELENVLEAGYSSAALYFDLGLLRSKGDRLESAFRHLQNAVKSDDYALAARLLMGKIQRQMGRLPDAATEYMEALKLADSLVVPPDQAAEVRQLYEPLIEAQAQQTETAKLEQLCSNIEQLVLRPNWRTEIRKAREQLAPPEEGMPLMPLAEILIQTQSSKVIDAIGQVRTLARSGHFRSAMDEAFESFRYAPTYLPLHTLVGDMLLQDGRLQDAVTKYAVVAQAYSVRGEAAQAIKVLRHIIELTPMDLAIRTRLIDLLVARSQVDEAIGEYIDLADIYYRLAELDMARKTYTTALRLAQQGNANRAWSIKLLQRMADIDMQHLDWRQALRIFEQLRTIDPDNVMVRKSLVDLNLRLNQPAQAAAELESFLTHLHGANRHNEVIPFLEELVAEDPQQPVLRRALAEEYRQAERIPEAIGQLDALGGMLLDAGDREGAIQMIEALIAMNPPEKEKYLTLLEQIKSGK